MKRNLIFLLLALWILPFSNPLAATVRKTQKQDFKIEKITLDYLSKGRAGFDGFEPSGLSGLSSGAGKEGKWAKIEVEYQSYPNWTDEVYLDFYVLVSGPLVLTERVTQINVAKGKRHHAAVYLHPTTILRYGQIQRIALQIATKEKVQDIAQWPTRSKKEWWNEHPAQSGLIKKTFQTPFSLDRPDRYEDTKI